MSALIVWMNKEEGKLFHLQENSINVEKVHASGPHHPQESLGRNHPQSQTDEARFFKALTAKLEKIKFEQLLFLGPSFAATHYVAYLEKSHSQLFKKVIGIEKVDKMPDSEILSIGRAFLHKYYLYHPA